MTRGFGFNTLQTTLLQIPYGLSQTLFMLVAACPLASKARLADAYQRSVNLGQLQDPSPQHPNLLDGVCPALHRRR